MPTNVVLPSLRLTAATASVWLLAACGSGAATLTSAAQRLAGTGLFADAATRTIAADALPFEPQYPLWSDGATKQRWITLPPRTAIDASDVDHWQFPIGTRLWKQFTFASGVETRFMTRVADGSWLYATYVRTADGDDVLAPANGVRAFCSTADGKSHDVPSLADCRLCHENGRTPVLGFSALQLSGDRDPLAPHAATPPAGAVNLATLVERSLLRGLPASFLDTLPRTAGRTPTERAVLGYLHGNCSGCHNADGPLQRLGLRLDHPLAITSAGGGPPALATTIDIASVFTRGTATRRVVPGSPADSVLFTRLAASDALGQMPPFGRHLVDRDAVALVERWIRDLAPATAPSLAVRHSTQPTHTTHPTHPTHSPRNK
jgi:hypothetical protein